MVSGSSCDYSYTGGHLWFELKDENKLKESVDLLSKLRSYCFYCLKDDSEIYGSAIKKLGDSVEALLIVPPSFKWEDCLDGTKQDCEDLCKMGGVRIVK